MKFEKLGKTTLKVTLKSDELSEIGISQSEIISNNENAKNLLSRLILLGASECGFELYADKYNVEVFALKSCYIIYISSAILRKPSCKKALMCKCDSIDDIVALSTVICRNFLKSCNTSLYSSKNKFYMVAKCVGSETEIIKNIFREFGEVSELSQLDSAILDERENILFSKRAAENIGRMFRIE